MSKTPDRAAIVAQHFHDTYERLAPEYGYKTRSKRDPGYCYLQAGFHRVGETKGGLAALQMLPADMPDAMAPIGAQEAMAV